MNPLNDQYLLNLLINTHDNAKSPIILIPIGIIYKKLLMLNKLKRLNIKVRLVKNNIKIVNFNSTVVLILL